MSQAVGMYVWITYSDVADSRAKTQESVEKKHRVSEKNKGDNPCSLGPTTGHIKLLFYASTLSFYNTSLFLIYQNDPKKNRCSKDHTILFHVLCGFGI